MARNGRVAKPFQKSGLFYVRRRVPNDLIAVIGKTHYLKSLKTSVAAEAAKRFSEANATVDAYFESLRANSGGWPVGRSAQTDLIDAAIERLIADASATQRKAVRFAVSMAKRNGVASSNDVPAVLEVIDPAARAHLVTSMLEDDLAPLLPSGVLPVPTRIQILQQLDAALPRLLTAWGLRAHTQNPERKFTPSVPQRDPNVRLHPLRESWERASKPCGSARSDAMNVINDLIDLYGDIPAMRFTSDDLDYFADELRHIPAAMTRAERALPFVSRVELGEDKTRPKCKPATPAKKLTLLKAILAYALHKRLITYNPAQKLETGHSYKANARRQFTNSEVTKLFSLPIFFDPKTWHFDLAISSSTVAWVGLIGLMSGSRLGEIAQAHVDDVLQDEGHVALSIRSEDDENLPRSVKTPGSERVIVLHPRIISLGFLDYLKAVKASGSTLVFPDVARVEGGLRSKEVSRRLNALVDEVIERPEVVFHSLRHTFKARARRAGVNPDIERQFTGHVPPDVSGQYGLAFITQLAEELSKIEFPMVPWDRISEAWTEVDWTQVVDRIRKDSPEVS